MAVMRASRRRISTAAALAVTALTLGTLSALPATAAPAAEGVIENAGAEGTIPGSYIVTLDETAQAETAEGRAVPGKFGAKIKRTYTSAVNGYAIELSEAQARKLAADPAVKSVVQNSFLTVDATQPSPPSWGLDRVDQKALPLTHGFTYPDSAGEGVTAYIIDTGVRVSHSDFGGRASDGFDAIDNDNIAQDGHGHGTHVAGTVAGTAHGVAKKAKIVGVRVLDNFGRGTTEGVVAGIDWVTRNAVKPAVANMSLGGRGSAVLDQAVRNSIASGVTYAVAAGNDNLNASNYSPARVTEAITVGATTNTDARSSFSNYGASLDLFAPGSSITSAWNTDDTATNTISGTSMATPHVAGAAALHLADNPTATPAQVSTALTAAATPDVVGNPGTGSPNKLLFAGGRAPNPGGKFENTEDHAIADKTTVESPITVSGVPGKAPSALEVSVNIAHTYIGDLRVQLIAPDGTVYRLKRFDDGDGRDNINTVYTVNASSESANGTWKLRVRDRLLNNTGKLDAWGLQF
ncbi:S8 family peptidase [Streptomyces sp. NPDC007325]|uniref:S8 family peptidase n=1 Tax=Streptomyces sp. NPDC007325 TaxID=3154588 RepID=UPI0033E6E96F